MSSAGLTAVGPDLVHGCVALVEERPLAGTSIQATGAGGGRSPDEIALHADSVDDVVAQAGVQLREGIDATGGDAAESTHRSRPDIAGMRIEGEGKHRLMSQSIGGTEDLPCTVLVESETVICTGPDALSVDKHAEDMIIGQTVRR